ncbi:hypothetical protein [Actinoplanes xinjiangensis]|uniref:PknH-like protein n=1 Tax=Actinoplanes xinjiangensis TaxID=512350 RepID=A0A316FHJ3_9ACTN|nr:hypothetical protein [Actinoplanes xinjiangensis]PWK47186.1 hypothetical protein BC793_108301 [Actinoplanes xinjiangensis]GIF40346.1 hypothetical protein Axi01nite_46570 [Actinoplanes xinjiangensis]
MRRIIALICAVPVLAAAAAVTGTAAATDGLAPSPAASPPLGDEYYTATDLRRGLLDVGHLPKGYTVDGDDDGRISMVDTDACSVYGYSEFGGSGSFEITAVRRAFRHADGSRLAIQLLAYGPEAVPYWIGRTAEPPTRCPVVTEEGYTIRNTRLPLPDVGLPAAGMVRISRYEQGVPSRRHSAVTGWGPVVVTIEETRTSESNQARFGDIAKAAAQHVKKIADGPSLDDLKRGLLTLAELPTGFRIVADDTVATRAVFTEHDCDGTVQRFGDERTAARRTFARGAATVTVAVGINAGASGIIGAMDSRVGECPTTAAGKVAAPPTISTDMTVGGIVYQDEPPRLRGITVYREVISDVQVTMTDGIDLAEAEEIRESALQATWRVHD